MGPVIIVYLIIIAGIAIAASTVRIVPQATECVVERLGAYKEVWGAGIHCKMPFIDKVAKKISLKEQVEDVKPQSVITKDNVTMQIDTIVYYRIVDARKFTYGVELPMIAMENIAATTLRNIIGEIELDQTLTSRDTINVKMRTILDEATDPWGIKINRVELQNIVPPKEIQVAMEKQMKAERERREAIIRAEGEKKAVVLAAEGEKEAAILRAEAKKLAQIAEAEGEARAILEVQKAVADGIKKINEANPSQAVIAIKALESLEKLADGQATKIVIPSQIQGLAGLATSLKELSADQTIETNK